MAKRTALLKQKKIVVWTKHAYTCHSCTVHHLDISNTLKKTAAIGTEVSHYSHYTPLRKDGLYSDSS